jgi:MFS family permease
MSAKSHTAAQPTDALTAGGLFVLALGALDFGLEQSTIVPALPRLAAHYQASAIATGWLATGFLLAATVAAPLFGRLGDLFGKRRLLLVSLSAFTLGSLLCALAESVPLAIAGRVVQGAGAAVAPVPLDLAGATLLGGGLVALLLAISKGAAWGWSSGAIVGLLVAAAVAFAAFVLVERRVARPLLDLALVARRPFVNANVCALTYGFGSSRPCT